MTGSRNLVRPVELVVVVVVVVVEILLYRRLQQGDGTFHYFTHFFAGASFALVLMTLAARRWRRPVRLPLLAVLAGHLSRWHRTSCTSSPSRTRAGWTCSSHTTQVTSYPAETSAGTSCSWPR